MIKSKNNKILKSALILLTILLAISTVASAAVVKIGLNYPKTGPYSVQGLAQLRAAEMAVEEINQAGGILGRNVELVVRDSKSKADLANCCLNDQLVLPWYNFMSSISCAYCVGSLTTVTYLWFLAAERSMEGPPISIFSTSSE